MLKKMLGRTPKAIQEKQALLKAEVDGIENRVGAMRALDSLLQPNEPGIYFGPTRIKKVEDNAMPHKVELRIINFFWGGSERK